MNALMKRLAFEAWFFDEYRISADGAPLVDTRRKAFDAGFQAAQQSILTKLRKPESVEAIAKAIAKAYYDSDVGSMWEDHCHEAKAAINAIETIIKGE